MPTSLIFAALVGTWLVVLVPLVAMRWQEVARTGDVALSSRVLARRGRGREHDEEMAVDSERPDQAPAADEAIDQDEAQRRFRPGRGGFDPEAAALAAQARYAFRQRVVVALLAGMVGTLLLALIASAGYWWLQGGFDLALVGYLGYLRRQVRIEEQVRQRRAERHAGARPAAVRREPDAGDGADGGEGDEHIESVDSAGPAAPPVALHPRAIPLDLDDEDPEFDDLASAYEPHYRKAVGE